MTAIYTETRIGHLIAAGRVRQHLAPTRPTQDRSAWAAGRSHPVLVPGRAAICRVIVHGSDMVDLQELRPRDLHDTGHRTALALARWWLRGAIARRVTEGRPWTDAQVMERFNAHREAVAIRFELDTTHQPRLLHEDPAQGYTHLPQRAAKGESEAVPDWDIERQVPAARERHAALQGLLEQQDRDALSTLEQRLQRVTEKARQNGVNCRDDLRVIEQRIHRLERKVSRTE